jgi:hypothetical protein
MGFTLLLCHLASDIEAIITNRRTFECVCLVVEYVGVLSHSKIIF